MARRAGADLTPPEQASIREEAERLRNEARAALQVWEAN